MSNLCMIIFFSFVLFSCGPSINSSLSQSQPTKRSVNTYELTIIDENGKPLDGVKINYKLFNSSRLAKEGTYLTKPDGKILMQDEFIFSTLSYTVEKEGYIPLKGDLSSHFKRNNIEIITMERHKVKPRKLTDKSLLDISISQLPPNYKGDDIEIIFNRLVNGESDIGHENNTIYKFVLPGDKIQRTGKVKYDFGSKSLKVMFSFNNMFKDGNLLKNLIKLKMTKSRKGSYLASNIFGATVNVKHYTGVDYNISVSNSNDILNLSQESRQAFAQTKQTGTPVVMPPMPPNTKRLYGRMDEEFHNIIIKFQASPELSRLSMEEISILFICKPKRPVVFEGRSGHDATLDHPTSVYAIEKCINVDVLEIWVLNTKSGEIYHKQQVM